MKYKIASQVLTDINRLVSETVKLLRSTKVR